MRVGLIDVDGHHVPNLALMKLSAWHKAKGDTVEWCFPLDHYGIVYQSKVFDNTYSPDIDWTPNADKIIKGGTGYGLDNTLPYEIEHIYPDYSLYPELTKDTAYGFLTRGCPRHCGFCIVGDKEGLRSVKVADLSEFWRGQKKIELLDPNLLACRDRMDLLDQLIDSKAMVNINQGFDIRLANEEVAEKLGRMRIKRIHFAWDNPREDLTEFFKRFAKAYRRKSSSTKVVYTLVNYNTTMEENLWRIYTLRDLGYDPYVMVFNKTNAPRQILDLQRWVNNRFIFRKCPKLEDYKSRKD